MSAPSPSTARSLLSGRVSSSRAGFVVSRLAACVLFACVALACAALLPSSAAAQSGPGAESSASDSTDAPIVRKVNVEGNTFFSDGELKKRIRTSPNRRILSIPGFTWWRWVYRLGDASWMWSRLGNALKSGGEPPAYLDSTEVSDDVERLRLFYEQQGFREAEVDVEVRSALELPLAATDRVTVTFRITPGTPTFIRTVDYDGLDALTPEQKQKLTAGTVFDVEDVDEDEGGDPPLQMRADEQRYEKPLLLEERRRLLTFLRNEGYATVTRDSIQAVIFRPAPDSFDVTFRVRPGARYRFGDVLFAIRGPEESVPTRRDTLRVPVDTTGGMRPRVVSEITNDSQLGTALLRRSLQFTPGDYYDREEVLATKRRLEGTGVFSFTNVAQRPDGVLTDSMLASVAIASADTVQVGAGQAKPPSVMPMLIEARTQRRHQVRAEVFGLQRDAVATSGSELDLSEFGVGTGVSYENVNAFGGGETFEISTSGSIATRLGSDPDNQDLPLITSAQLEATTSLTLPYLVRPFNRFENVFDLENARTRLSLNFLTARRSDLGLRIRGQGNARMRLEMEHSPTLTSLFDVVEVSLSNPDTLRGFRTRFLDRVFGTPGSGQGITDPVQRAQIIEDYTQPQINTTVRYTLRSIDTNALRRRRGHSYEASVEVGNTVPTLLDEFVFQPGSLEYRLPGLSGGRVRRDTVIGDDGRPTVVQRSDSLIYRPYVRLTTDLRRYVPLGGTTTLAFKFNGGIGQPTAGPNLLPFDRRFFAGGATSVRGWGLRELGPGDVSFAQRPTDDGGRVGDDDVVNILGGDVKLESSVELRRRVIRSLFAAEWVGAAFVDAGNVWFGPRNPGFDGTSSEDGTTPEGNGRFRVPDFLTEVGVGSGVGVRIEWEYLVVRFDLAWRVHDPDPNSPSSGPLLHFGIGQAF